MKKILFLLIFLIFLIFLQNVYAHCDEEQININTASKEDLDQLYGIGEVKADAIINSRPFESVDDLINVNGIGEITLQKIKDQELACVDKENGEEDGEEENKTDNEEVEEKEEEGIDDEEIFQGTDEKDNFSQEAEKNISKDIIKLNTKDIKSEINKKILEKENLAKFGFIIFCILLVFLFAKKFKNEFRK